MTRLHENTHDSTCRYFSLLVLLVLAFICSPGKAGEQGNAPTLHTHVTDFATVLPGREVMIEQKLKAFEAATGHQIFVLTVPTTGNRAIEEYAVEVFEKSKIGQQKRDDGVLFVIAANDNKMRIEVGYGLEGVLTDAQCSRIIHDIVAPEFKVGRLNTGIEAGVDAIFRTIAPSFVYSPAPSPDTATEPHINKYVLIAIGGIFILLFGLMAISAGVLGLVVLGVLMLVFATKFPGVEGKLYSAAILATWFLGRWKLIAQNVRQHHLKASKNHLLTWLWCFLVMPGSGRPQRKGEPSLFTSSFSFGGSKGRGSSTDDDTTTCGRGGRSGGAGATGEW